VRPRNVRWKAWECASTKPRSRIAPIVPERADALLHIGRRLGRRRGRTTILDGVATRAVSSPLAQLPNALTVARLLLVPVFVVLLASADDGESVAAALVFAAAGITDQIDGFLARRWHVESPFGKIADPLADRLMIDAAVLMLWWADRLPWVALLIPARDLLLIGVTPLAVRRGYRFEVNLAGKAATWLLYASLVFVMLTSKGTDWPLWLFWAGVVLALVSLAGYALKARGEVGT
jgi:CDP-diacylglycerol--glycerol-3-phosphate 3-phosphatidyltransferase